VDARSHESETASETAAEGTATGHESRAESRAIVAAARATDAKWERRLRSWIAANTGATDGHGTTFADGYESAWHHLTALVDAATRP
jgi:hypothetical protein